MYQSIALSTSMLVDNLADLFQFKNIMEALNLKINKSQIAKKLGVNRRTVCKYLDGYTKPKHKKKGSYLDKYYDIILDLLSSPGQIFYYKRVLWQYLQDNYGLRCPQSTFRDYILKHEELNAYFTNSNKHSKLSSKAIMRYETPPAEQAQLDWKESIEFTTRDGEVLTVNILVLLLSSSRYRIYRLSLSKETPILLSLLTECFEALGGVAKTVLTDNMKTVMKEPRTEYRHGEVNKTFEEFAKDFGFKVLPCIAGRPQTKAKVESPMKILDEIRAYNGKLNYVELNELVCRINERVNCSYNQGSGGVPMLEFQKEKEFLSPLPNEKIRNSYKISTFDRKVNSSSMISYEECQYSVPPKYISKTVQIQIYSSNLYIYYNTKLIAMHAISNKKLNYNENHYTQIVSSVFKYKEKSAIEDIAKENLKHIGGYYDG